ncbi:4'-phosphopantetheinyl transferase family protein [Pedobacter immunditicola]|uniref:4'-phosphopantetheinyl transferase family protein n=1 Tax=Pedobacter immunditicola TaxID=3133440 RepID=UPI0030AFE0A3
MPIVYNKNVDDQTILAVWKIQETEEELIAGLQLKQHELEFLSSLNNGKRLLHWLSTRLLLRTMLNTDDYIDCRMDDHGKPYLVNIDYEISLSHSYDYAAVMISKDKKVGVDIELMKDKIQLIKHKFLSVDELKQQNLDTSKDGLYVSWCVKEAIYKWNGRKGLELKKDMFVKAFDLKEAGDVDAVVSLPDRKQPLQASYFKTDDGYMLAYVMA